MREKRVAEATVEEEDDEDYNVSRGRRDRGREHGLHRGCCDSEGGEDDLPRWLSGVVVAAATAVVVVVMMAAVVEWPGDRTGKTARPSLTAADVCTRLQAAARTRTPSGIVPSRAATPRRPLAAKCSPTSAPSDPTLSRYQSWSSFASSLRRCRLQARPLAFPPSRRAHGRSPTRCFSRKGDLVDPRWRLRGHDTAERGVGFWFSVGISPLRSLKFPSSLRGFFISKIFPRTLFFFFSVFMDSRFLATGLCFFSIFETMALGPRNSCTLWAFLDFLKLVPGIVAVSSAVLWILLERSWPRSLLVL